ncbi:MAG: hypothetical protein WAK16_03385 [Candidatus Cybelea sp.]
MGAALALRSAARLARSSSARIRSGATLQSPAGTVSAFFALEAFDRRRGVAIYALHVVNQTKSTLVCRTWVTSQKGEPVLAYPVPFKVEPLSTSATEIPVWPADYASFGGAVAEVVGQGVHCVVQAPPPTVKRGPSAYVTIAAASLGIGLLALIAAGILGQALPRIAALAVPPSALAGTTVEAQYTASGAGRLTYAVVARNGRRLESGALAERSGLLPITLPAAGKPQPYEVQMVMAGPLGSVDETRTINAVASHAGVLRGARIGMVSVDPVVARPGQTIDVAYQATADSGYVALLGVDGTVWGEAPFSRSGDTRFIVPPGPSFREMRVLVRVRRGHTIAQSMAGLVVADMPSTAGSVIQVAGDNETETGAVVQGAENGTFQVLTPRVRSGSPIRVRIISPRNNMRVALTDTQSREVTHLDAGADADVVTLRAPLVGVATRYVVVVSFNDGFGQESIVQPVTVFPYALATRSASNTPLPR